MRSFIHRAAGTALGLALAGAAGAQGPVLSPEQLFERVAPSVWTVRTYDADNLALATGSAVVIGPGTLVTNCHVIAKARRVAVVREKASFPAMLEHPDIDRDLCTLKVRDFTAPAVVVADPGGLKVGARVYAIGSPRGLEQTIGDGLLSGLRRDDDDRLHALQFTVPISPGSSGGGLFDAQGRLIGITTYQLRDSQNLNFAVPASWIAEVPQRGEAALAAMAVRPRRPADDSPALVAIAPPAPAAPIPAPIPAHPALPAPIPAPIPAPTPELGRASLPFDLAEGRVFEYRLRDRLTGQQRTVSYRVDEITGERVSFNQGQRIELKTGEVVSVSAPAAGESDTAMPPGGWLQRGTVSGATWRIKHSHPMAQGALSMDLVARAVVEEDLLLAAGSLRALRVEFEGFTTRGTSIGRPPTGRYRATGWYVGNRVVRFDVRTRGGVGGDMFIVDESLELVGVR